MKPMSLDSLRFATLLKAGGTLDRMNHPLPSGEMQEDAQLAWASGAPARDLMGTLELLGAAYGLSACYDMPKNGSSYLHIDADHARFTVRLSDHQMPPFKEFFQRDSGETPTLGIDLWAVKPGMTVGTLAIRILAFFSEALKASQAGALQPSPAKVPQAPARWIPLPSAPQRLSISHSKEAI